MGLFDKAKAAAEQAAAKAKEGVEDVQLKRDLHMAYNELGKAAAELVEAGEIAHARLQPLVEKVASLREKAGADATPSQDGSNGHDPSQPPAMPT